MNSIPGAPSPDSDERPNEPAVVFGGLRAGLDFDDSVFEVDPEIQRRFFGDE
jgi:hypothetical protein